MRGVAGRYGDVAESSGVYGGFFNLCMAEYTPHPRAILTFVLRHGS